MSDKVEVWLVAARDAVGRLLGGSGRAALEEEWAAHEREPKPVVVLFGPYDSGKTSLLKRLLVDESRQVPEWATVSGRRETFEVQSVEVCGCTLLDTPGIAGGNAEHEALARDPIARADAILLVLPPQLLTAEKEVVTRLVSGSALRPGGVPPGDGLLVAIGRMDEGGRDPADDLGGYRELCRSKEAELRDLLQHEGLGLSARAVFPLAADPYQQVGNRIPKSREVYDEFREWDGIEAIASALSGLQGRLTGLRRVCLIRFHCEALTSLLGDIRERTQRAEASSSEAENGMERIALLESELGALSGAARTRLDLVVEEQLASVIRSGFTSAEDVRKQLEPRMKKAFERWRSDHEGQILKLAAGAHAELTSRLASPGGKAFRSTVEAPSDSGGRRNDGFGRAQRVGGRLKKLLRERQEKELGMSFSKAREELRKLEEAGSFEKYREVARRSKTFNSVQHAEKAGKAVSLHKALDTIGPIVAELGPLIIEQMERRRKERDRKERREALRADVERASNDLSADCWSEWTQMVKEFEEWIEVQKKPHESALPGLKKELAELRAARVELEELLERAPTDP